MNSIPPRSTTSASKAELVERPRADWWKGEQEMPFARATTLFPRCDDGRPVSLHAIYRYSLAGLSLGDGRRLRLRRFKSGPRWCTTAEEVERFKIALTRAHGGDV